MAGISLQDWVGRTQEFEDQAYPTPVRALAATLGRDVACEPGSPLPALWHWLYFLPVVPMSQVGPDGHPKRGGFLPPVPLERRMWAGGRLTFHDSPRIGEPIGLRSEILKVVEKEGKAGRMVFVTVGHRLSTARGLAVEEEQDIVYVAMPEVFTPPPPMPAPPTTNWADPVAVDTVLLFRYSALTFNGHRIHYDLAYATQVEKYPGLVVHGPLQAMLLLAAAERHQPQRRPARYSFKGVRPLFHFETVRTLGWAVEGGGHELCTANGDNAVCMQASVAWHQA